jgi:uncharacterized membrane protein YedE/YeeE
MNEDMSAGYWPGWFSGVVLSALVVAYFWVTGRLVASSGRVTKVIDRLRHGPVPECSSRPEELAELAEALRLATVETFGADAVQQSLTAAQASESEPPRRKLRLRAQLNWIAHLAFLLGIVIGGRMAQPLAPLRWTLGEGVWAGAISERALPYLLLFSGILVGFGTRMAGGCPIGHGLCGMAQGQAGSWAAGLSFFGAGVGIAFLVGWL